MPIWAIVYITFIVVGGLASIYTYRYKGFIFIAGELFSLLFSFVLILYYFNLLVLPKSFLIPLFMLGYIIIWEWIINFDLLEEELLSLESKEEIIIFLIIGFLVFFPLIYMSGNVIGRYF